MKALVGEKVAVEPWSQVAETMERVGLTLDDVLSKAWYVSADSTRVLGGAEAINATIRHVWYLWPISWLYYVPGMRQLQDRIYQWIADNRYKLPGSTAACAIPAAKPTDSAQSGALK